MLHIARMYTSRMDSRRLFLQLLILQARHGQRYLSKRTSSEKLFLASYCDAGRSCSALPLYAGRLSLHREGNSVSAPSFHQPNRYKFYKHSVFIIFRSTESHDCTSTRGGPHDYHGGYQHARSRARLHWPHRAGIIDRSVERAQWRVIASAFITTDKW